LEADCADVSSGNALQGGVPHSFSELSGSEYNTKQVMQQQQQQQLSRTCTSLFWNFSNGTEFDAKSGVVKTNDTPAQNQSSVRSKLVSDAPFIQALEMILNFHSETLLRFTVNHKPSNSLHLLQHGFGSLQASLTYAPEREVL